MRLHGRIDNRAGTPVEGAYVRLVGPSGDFTAEVRTDESGRFLFYPAPGEWSLRVLIPGGSSLEREVTLNPGQSAEIQLRVDDAAGPSTMEPAAAPEEQPG